MPQKGHKIYIHRERGHVYISFFKGMASSDVLNLRVEGFLFVASEQDDLGKFGCKITIFTAGRQRFAGINLDNGKVYFDTKLGIEKILKKFLDSLQELDNEISCTDLEHDYIEICARFPWNKVEEAFRLLKIIEVSFRTKYRSTEVKSHDTLRGGWLYLVKDVLFGKFTANIKVYLFFEYSGKKFNMRRITGFGIDKLPKVEVQISNPDYVEEAKAEAVSIILAFLDTLNCPSFEMTEADYELVTFAEKCQEGSQQIFLHLKNANKKAFPIFLSSKPGKRDREIISFIAEEPRSIQEIKGLFEVSENTIRADMARLEKEGVIYSRGRIGVEKMYAIKLQPYKTNRPLLSIPTTKATIEEELKTEKV